MSICTIALPGSHRKARRDLDELIQTQSEVLIPIARKFKNRRIQTKINACVIVSITLDAHPKQKDASARIIGQIKKVSADETWCR